MPVSNPLQLLIVIDTGQYRYERSIEVEPHGVIIASIITLLLAYALNCLYNERGISFTLAVIAPYAELVSTVYQSFHYLKTLLSIDLSKSVAI